jgi:hypothetical protein
MGLPPSESSNAMISKIRRRTRSRKLRKQIENKDEEDLNLFDDTSVKTEDDDSKM